MLLLPTVLGLADFIMALALRRATKSVRDGCAMVKTREAAQQRRMTNNNGAVGKDKKK
jgi:hypothetical protein